MFGTFIWKQRTGKIDFSYLSKKAAKLYCALSRIEIPHGNEFQTIFPHDSSRGGVEIDHTVSYCFPIYPTQYCLTKDPPLWQTLFKSWRMTSLIPQEGTQVYRTEGRLATDHTEMSMRYNIPQYSLPKLTGLALWYSHGKSTYRTLIELTLRHLQESYSIYLESNAKW